VWANTTRVTGADDNTNLKMALAMLARGLAGAIETSGLDHLPRPLVSAPQPSLPSATAPRPPSAPLSRQETSSTVSTVPTVVAGPAIRERPAMAPPTVTAPPASLEVAWPDQPIDTGSRDALVARLSALASSPGSAPERLRVLQDDIIGACTRCKLHRGRNQLVFGVGNPDADLVFVGEGPGEDEDRQGIPFVGRAGQLLTKMITAMGRDRDRDVYICNVVKCRPPNNRNPEADEVEACLGFLNAQLAVVRPKVIVGLGGVACHTLLKTSTPISKLRGTWQRYEGIDFMPTFHPSYLLREERDPAKARKRETWEDLKLVMERLAIR
jgi:uracil-DNA glycosylase family 4